jgi:hypothetical protein
VINFVRYRVEYPSIHFARALVNFLPKAIQLPLGKIEALSSYLFGILKVLLYLCESLIHSMIASIILVLVPLKFASYELTLLLKL